MFFFWLGLISILGQIVLLREIVNLSYGNEVFYILALGLWLLLAALGGFGGRKAKKFSTRKLWLLLTALGLLLPLLVIGIRLWAAKIVMPGQLLSFGQAGLLLALSLVFFAPILGWLFITGLKSFKNLSFNLAYFWETLGFFVGGLFFSFFLASTSFPLPERINQSSLRKIYPELKEVSNSPYQQIIRTEKEEQINFYLSGQLTFSLPAKTDSQLLAGLIWPFVGQLNQVLVVGQPELASALALYPQIKTFKWIEIDPLLLAAQKEFLPPVVKSIRADLRKHLAGKIDSLGLILLSLPAPSSLSLNRFYTREFWQVAHNSLAKDGVLALVFSLPTNYQSEEAVRLGSSLYQTFTSIFKNNELFFLEDQLLLLGGKEKLVANRERFGFLQKIYPAFSADFFDYQRQRIDRQLVLDRWQKTSTQINRDLRPVSFFYQTLFWQTLFNFRLPKIIYHLGFWLPIVFLISMGILIGWFKKKEKRLVLAGISSFILMSLQVLLVFLFQANFGSLYSQLAFIFGLVLLGMSFGVGLVEKKGWDLRKIGYPLVGYVLVMAGLVLVKTLWFWWGLAWFLGFNGGLVFGMTVSDLAKNKKKISLVYPADLIGAFLGAVLTSLFFFPVLGLLKLYFLLILLILLAAWCARSP
ncbi:hypothetical protein ISS42_00735 [Candidatus Shapirobacteria bacterium]|nr:hypothetical protein [Candidatus Shapirobacteria bacterium]